MTPEQRAKRMLIFVRSGFRSNPVISPTDQENVDFISDMIQEAILEEREACAKACHEVTFVHTSHVDHGGATDEWLSEKCAQAIRERGKA